MQQPQQSRPPESLSGLIERITFFNAENGFGVLQVKAKGQRDLVTVIGSLPVANAGEWLVAEGQWVHDRQYGRQFRADVLKTTPPTSREGIEKYLGSGMVKGIGPVYAGKLVQKFGANILEILDKDSGRLEEVEGIGPTRRARIKSAWTEQRIVRDIMLFLHSHGVSTSRAVRIYKTYGERAIDTVRANPYALARDIHGIGFNTADQIAGKVGIPADSMLRACAGLSHVLWEATGEGHCALPVALLKEKACELLQVREELVTKALQRTVAARELVLEIIGGVELAFLPRLKNAEEQIAARVQLLSAARSAYPPIDIEKAISWCEQKTGKILAPSQREALRRALTSRVLVLTGGPGVGKTTLINALLRILTTKKVQCILCAPTGRAAKRLSETTGMEASTIHRLLEATPAGFARNESKPIECDLLIVDECSMVDLPLMNYLLRALPANAALLLVGDVDQLASVGPGTVLRDFIESSTIPVVRLTEIFRQAANSEIVTSAHRINQGLMPVLPVGEPADGVKPPGSEGDSDFYFIEREAPEQIAQTLLQVVKTRIPTRFKLHPIRDIQVLSPMNRGSLGVRELNTLLQSELNPARPDQPAVEKFGAQFRIGDKVIQTENNYDKEVFNGDIGQISRIEPNDREVAVRYDDREVLYDFNELDEITLAYAISIHKSQGSEFSAVVIPLATQHYMLLQRNLVYTGITRGKKLVVLIGQSKALQMAVRNCRSEQRFSGLLDRLRSVVEG
jgi:exodeoxyribonuclease V alpha subunit